jgi:hypothetical protein
MPLIATSLSRFLALICLGAALPAHACKLASEAYDLNAFLDARKSGQVVFIGTVTSVESLPPSEYLLVDQRFAFETTRWWRGTPRQTISGRGYISKPTGSSCDGHFDFSAKGGQLWLIVGNVVGGEVRPSTLLSQQLTDGEVPQEVLRILDAHR